MTHFGLPRRSLSPKDEEVPALNWRRGLFRVWLLFCAAWLMSWIIYLIMYGLHGGFKTTGDLLVIPVLLFGPPIAPADFRLCRRLGLSRLQAGGAAGRVNGGRHALS